MTSKSLDLTKPYQPITNAILKDEILMLNQSDLDATTNRTNWIYLDIEQAKCLKEWLNRNLD